MQRLRNLSWWFIGLTTFTTFAIVVFLSTLLGDTFEPLPSSVVITIYFAFGLGLLNKTKLFQLGDTLIHEIGHAQFVALTLGTVKSIHVQRDTSGVTQFHSPKLFQRLIEAIVSISGPLASFVVFVITARLIASGLTQYWVTGAVLFIILILITTIRNFMGWIVGVCILFVLYVLLESTGFIEPFLLNPDQSTILGSYLSHVIFGLTAFNCGVALRYSFKMRVPKSHVSDEARFGNAIFLGPRIGGYLILVVQLYLLLLALSYILGWSSPLAPGRFF